MKEERRTWQIGCGCRGLDSVFRVKAMDVDWNSLIGIWVFGFQWTFFSRRSKLELSISHLADCCCFLILAFALNTIIREVIQTLQAMSKVIFPNSSASLELKLQGIFATPDQWKTTDDANPSLFTYTARFFQFQIEKGKIFPRELTAKEQREQQQKNKKGGKKQSKKEEGNTEEERLRKIEQEEAAKREEEWNKLPAEDRNYRQYEDSFKSPQLRFEINTKKVKLQGKEYTIFEERVSRDQGEWIYVYKAPTVSEDQLAKMRKTKPKTLTNINDLNPIMMRAWVDLSAFNSKDCKKLTQRCKLSQVDRTPETPEPNLENTYIKVSISLESPFLRGQDGVIGQQLIADPPLGEILSDRVKVVNQLRDQLRLAISSLSMEYSSMFWKELNIYEDFKNMNYFINKKNEITKRKEQFLYDFNVSGKYKILKDRIKKVIVHLCESFFTEQMGNSKSFTGISCSIKDQFYSQIYNFLVTKYRQILQELIFQKKENLKEVEVLSAAAQKKNVDKLLNSYQQQAIEDRITRIVEEYELLGNYQYGEGIFKKYMEAEPSNVGLKYSYSMYCLRNKLKKAEEILPFVEQYLSYNKDDQKVRLEYLLLLIASQNEQNCRKAWVLLREILAIDPYNTKNLMLASFLFKDFLQAEEIGNIFSVRAERSALRSSNKIGEIGRHKQKSIPSQLPTLKALPSFNESLSSQQKDQIWIQLLNLFLSLNLFNVIEKITPKIKDASNEIFNILSLKNLLSQSRHEEFQAKAREVYEKNKSVEVLDLLVTYFVATKNAETEKYLKVLLVRSKGAKQTLILLKMAHYYLQSKQIGNSRACVLKYLEKKPTNSGFSWRMLGICEIQLNNLETALECLRKANILDIDNPDNWVWLANVYALQGKYSMSNQCLNQYELITSKQSIRSPVYEDIYSIVAKSNADSPCEQKLRIQLAHRLG